MASLLNYPRISFHSSCANIKSPSHAFLRSFTNTTYLRSNNQRQEPSSPSSATKEEQPPNPRLLSSLPTRLGHCITFGLSASQTDIANDLLHTLTTSWRPLLAGSQGYLTSPTSRGLYRHKVNWGDMDSMGHVNNVIYNKYAESSRVNWTLHYAKTLAGSQGEKWRDLCTSKGEGLILRSIKTEFKFPMTYPDRVSVFHRLSTRPEAGHEGLMFDVLIMSERHRRVVAKCEEDVVLYDYRTGKKIELPKFMLEPLQETWEEQEAVRRRETERSWEVVNRMRELELDSWDRPDAKEEFGSRGQ